MISIRVFTILNRLTHRFPLEFQGLYSYQFLSSVFFGKGNETETSSPLSFLVHHQRRISDGTILGKEFSELIRGNSTCDSSYKDLGTFLMFWSWNGSLCVDLEKKKGDAFFHQFKSHQKREKEITNSQPCHPKRVL